MARGPFLPTDFVPTKFSTAADKADYGNAFLHLVGAEWKRVFLPRSSIADYATHSGTSRTTTELPFTPLGSAATRTACAFSTMHLTGLVGAILHSPSVTQSVPFGEIRKRNYLGRYELKAAESLHAVEMALLERFQAKYQPAATQIPNEVLRPETSASGSSAIVTNGAAPVQGCLF